MKIALLILFIGACNALPAPQFPDFHEMDRQLKQQMADMDRRRQQQMADMERQMSRVDQQVAEAQKQVAEAQKQAAEAQKQAADAMNRSRQLGFQNQDNSQFMANNGIYSSVTREERFHNGVRSCTETRIHGVTGQVESFSC